MKELEYHWCSAGRLAKKILRDFRKKVSYEEFCQWSSNNFYKWVNKGKFKFTVIIRHTKNWCCHYDYANDLIKVYLTDIVLEGSTSYINKRLSAFELVLLGTLTHEITHFMQYYYNLGSSLSEQELKHYNFRGYEWDDNKTFLYMTNWIEMDADLSAAYCIYNYNFINKKMLVDFYRNWSNCKKKTNKMIADYVYDYWWRGVKNFELRESISKFVSLKLNIN